MHSATVDLDAGQDVLRLRWLALCIAVLLHLAAVLLLRGMANTTHLPTVTVAKPVQATVLSAVEVDAAVQQLQQQKSRAQAQAKAEKQALRRAVAQLQQQEKQVQKRVAALKKNQQHWQKAAAQAKKNAAQARRQAEAAAVKQPKSGAKPHPDPLTQLAQTRQHDLMQAEAEALHALQSSVSEQQLAQYKQKIVRKIAAHWRVPKGSDPKLACQLAIHLAPDGTVLDVALQHSSGLLALDRSARTAVLRASPLPVPNETRMFSAFRHFVLTVRPETVLS